MNNNDELKAAIEEFETLWKNNEAISGNEAISTIYQAARELLQLKEGTHPDMVIVPLEPKYKRVDLSLKREMRNPVKQGGKSNDWYQNGYDVGYNAAIDDIKSKYGDLYAVIEK